MNPKYEAALTLFLSGEHEKAIDYLNQLKTEKKGENESMNEDYIFLIKKIIYYNKLYGKTFQNTSILLELSDIAIYFYNEDTYMLFDNIEFVIINLILSDHLEAIKFIENVIKKELIPPFFNHIFNYYLGVKFIFIKFNLVF